MSDNENNMMSYNINEQPIRNDINKEFLDAMADWTLSEYNKEPAIPPNCIKYKYKENVIIKEFHDYIDRTYGEHYAADKLQAFDAWLVLGDATPTFRNTAIKYLWRYGKKKGNNKDDLMKVLHYTMMMLYNDFYKENN